jgi:hypothetical protein
VWILQNGMGLKGPDLPRCCTGQYTYPRELLRILEARSESSIEHLRDVGSPVLPALKPSPNLATFLLPAFFNSSIFNFIFESP